MINTVTLLGNLGADPEVRTFQNGGRVCNLRVATTERWKDRNSGENKERTEWHSVVVFADGLVDVCERYLRKGSKVYIEGQLQTRKWQDQSGQDRYSTEVAVRPYKGSLLNLDKRDEEAGYRQGPFGTDSQTGPTPGMDDEIPF